MASELKKPAVRAVNYDFGTQRKVRQMEFVRHYVSMEKRDHEKAAELAGYKHPKRVGFRLMKVPWIIQEIQKHMEESNFRTKVDTDLVKRKLLELIDGCMQKMPILDSEGQDTGLYKFVDAGVARGAIKDLGEHVDVQAFVKNFKADINHNINTQSDLDISRLPMEDQQKLLEIVMKAKAAQVVDGPPKRIACEVLQTETSND